MYDVKPVWKLLGARKQAREVLIPHDQTIFLKVEAHSEVLSSRLAWNVLGHRHVERMKLSQSIMNKKAHEDRKAEPVVRGPEWKQQSQDAEFEWARQSEEAGTQSSLIMTVVV